MTAHPNRLLLIALVLGWLFDFFFWKQSPGMNFPIFAALTLLGGSYWLAAAGVRPDRRSLVLLAPIAFFAVVTILRSEPMTRFLAYCFTLLVMAIFALTYAGGRWLQYAIHDYLGKGVALLLSMIARPLMVWTETRSARKQGSSAATGRSLWPVVRGITIALPIVAVFAALLASADLVFGQRLRDLLELFRLENLPEYIFRLILILAAAYALGGVILHAAARSNDEDVAAGGRRLLTPFLGATESAIVLGSVVVLFAAFVTIQFQYFFGGQMNIHIDGYTYSEYARRGFGELVTVAFFTLVMLQSLSTVTKRDTDAQRRMFSGLGATIVALLLVMLLSAYQRLELYEAAYGFSRLRTYTHAALIWLALLLVVTIILELLRQERRFALVALIGATGFAATLPLLNVDAFIVRQNIAREVRGPQVGAVVELDVYYFLEMSDDALPQLVELYEQAPLAAATKEQVGAALVCIRQAREQALTGRRGPSWQSFHVARRAADAAFQSVKSELDAYAVNDTEWPAVVTTPEGEEFPCWRPYTD